jgi:hypothetical protein
MTGRAEALRRRPRRAQDTGWVYRQVAPGLNRTPGPATRAAQAGRLTPLQAFALLWELSNAGKGGS